MSSELTALENETAQKEDENDLKRCQKVLCVCARWGGEMSDPRSVPKPLGSAPNESQS